MIPEIDVPGGDFTAVSVVFAAATIDNGTLIVHGLASATSVNAGGVQTVLAGGIDQGAQISGGIEQVLAGGSASGTIVNSGGTIELFGGTAVGTVVDSGGVEDVVFGGTASGTTLSGGTMEVFNGGSTGSGPITFTNAGGILQLVIAGFASPSGVTEEIDLRDIVFGDKTRLSFKEDKNDTSGTLTVTDGTHTANLTLLGRRTISHLRATAMAGRSLLTRLTPAGTRCHWSVPLEAPS